MNIQKTKIREARTRSLRIRLTEGEHRLFLASAKLRGVPLSTLIRGLVCCADPSLARHFLEPGSDTPQELLRMLREVKASLNQPEKAPEPKVDPELIRMVARVGNILNQIAKHCHESRLAGTPSDAARLFDSLEVARKELHRLAGIRSA